MQHCAAHCTEQIYVPVETDKQTTANCAQTFEKSVRTSVNLCARTQFLSVYTLTHRITLCAHSGLLLLQEGKYLCVRTHMCLTFVCSSAELFALGHWVCDQQGVLFLYAYWQNSAQKSAQKLCRTLFWWNRTFRQHLFTYLKN